MVVLALGTILCVIEAGSRAWLTEWTATALMAVGMIWLVAGGAVVFCAAVLLISGMLYALGPVRSVSAHRGLTSIAMAGLALLHGHMASAAVAASTAPMHDHSGSSNSDALSMLVWAVALAAVGFGIHHLRQDPGSSTRIRLHGARRRMWWGRAEIALMTAALALMAVPM